MKTGGYPCGGGKDTPCLMSCWAEESRSWTVSRTGGTATDLYQVGGGGLAKMLS